MSDLSAQGKIRLRFVVKHGGMENAIPLEDGYWWIFPDGALMERPAHGVTHDPPEDKAKRYKLTLLYWKERMRQSKKKFEDLKEQVIATFSEGKTNYDGFHFDGTRKEAERAVHTLREEVVYCREEYQRWTTKLKRLTEPPPMTRAEKREEREADEAEAREAERNGRFLDRVNNTKV